MGRIISPDEHEGMTPEQVSKALLPQEIPPCQGPQPGVECKYPKQNVIILGYDDRPRCALCNKIHLSLVEREAGSGEVNSTPQFVSPRLRDHSKRQEAIDRVYDGLEKKGHVGRPTKAVSTKRIPEGEAKDMKDALARDKFKTNEQGISDVERRARIKAKYSRR